MSLKDTFKTAYQKANRPITEWDMAVVEDFRDLIDHINANGGSYIKASIDRNFYGADSIHIQMDTADGDCSKLRLPYKQTKRNDRVFPTVQFGDFGSGYIDYDLSNPAERAKLAVKMVEQMATAKAEADRGKSQEMAFRRSFF